MTLSRHQAVGAYRRWDPPAFDAEMDAAPEAAEVPAAEPPPPNETGCDADAEHEPAVRLPTADEIETMYEQARTEGRAVGYEEGKADARAEAERLAKVVAAMDDALDHLDGDIAGELVTLATAIARQMVRHTLVERPDAITETVKDALQHLPQSKIRVRLHPDDAALVREYLSDRLEHGHHHIIEDANLTRGGCVLEAAGCEIDGTLETRWRRIMNGLGHKNDAWDAQDA